MRSDPFDLHSMKDHGMGEYSFNGIDLRSIPINYDISDLRSL